MLPTLANVALCALIAILLCTTVGLPIAASSLPRLCAAGAAPIVGWAVISAISLPIFMIAGMSRGFVATCVFVTLCGAIAVILRGRKKYTTFILRPGRLVVPIVAAALVAASTLPAVMPHIEGDLVAFAAPIFDHSKIAIVAEMARSGVPPVNPVFGLAGTTAPLPYYYLWHYSAALLAVLGGFSAWEADAALTWFTAFSSLTLMMGLAVYLSGSRAAAVWVAVLALTASVRPLLTALVGWEASYGWTGFPSGFGAWISQIAWAPQHVASAGCVVVATIMLPRISVSRPAHLLLFAILAAAAFESSTWVGGIAFVGICLATIVASKNSRYRLFVALAAAAVVALLLAYPVLRDQMTAMSQRGGGSPLMFAPTEVLGPQFGRFARILDIPAYWLLYLPVELSATYLIGVPAIVWWWRKHRNDSDRDAIPIVAVWGVFASLAIGGLLRSTVSPNNDLSWRSVLPAIMILIAFGAAGLANAVKARMAVATAIAAIIIGLGLISGGTFVVDNVIAKGAMRSNQFSESAEMWDAVRRTASASDRILNNPAFLDRMTMWPVNISWALLSDRRSCYAHGDLALPFAPMAKASLVDLDALVGRVFDGRPIDGDIEQLAVKFGCRVVIFRPEDGAWSRDPLADGRHYELADFRPGRWRIYRLIKKSEISEPD